VTALVVRNDFLKSRADPVGRFMRAYLEEIWYLQIRRRILPRLAVRMMGRKQKLVCIINAIVSEHSARPSDDSVRLLTPQYSVINMMEKPASLLPGSLARE
jgi:hypothetical protein